MIFKKLTIKKLALLAAISASASLTGCGSNQYQVTYDTNPRAAAITCGGQPQGYSPTTLYYPKEAAINGVINTSPCSAKWTSGAEAYFQTRIDMTAFPNGVVYTAPRPDTPGYDTDARVAFEADQNRRAINSQREPQNTYQYTPKNTYCNKIGTQVLCNSF